MKIVNGHMLSDEKIEQMLREGYTVGYVDIGGFNESYFEEPQGTLGDIKTDEPTLNRKRVETSSMNSYTVVLNAPRFNETTPHVSHVETSVKARSFDEAVKLVRLLKFEVELEITSISKDR